MAHNATANLLNLDYEAEAARLGTPVAPIIDVHSHINGEVAAAVYKRARDMYGVVRTYSMSQLGWAETVRRVLGDSIRFIAVPDFMAKDRAHALGEGFMTAMDQWHALGARMVKWWCAPRGRDLGREAGDWRLFTMENPLRRKQMDHAVGLGMMFMAHIADPDTWFKTKYSDETLYWKKRDHYTRVEEMLGEYRATPWILAHMGGWPEDLGFLDGLLSRHPNLHLDTSATKWMVRELSKHSRAEYVGFLTKFRGRILFGSDIVSSEAHVGGVNTGGPPSGESKTPEEAFELYASRYWALRVQYETAYEGMSPIADPDLKLVEPDKYDDLSSPPLRGHDVPKDVLREIYHDAAARLVERWYDEKA
jgi:hypothetical protein